MKQILTTLSILLTLTMQAHIHPVFFGTNTGGNGASKGIYVATFDAEDGAFTSEAQLTAEIPFPGFLAHHPSRQVIYSTSSETVVAFQIIEKDGFTTLSPLNAVPTESERAAHVAVAPDGTAVVTAHYGTGRVVVFPLQKDGTIGPASQTIQLKEASGINAQRQEAPHPHSAFFDLGGRYLLVPDLGADTTYIYAFDPETSTLTPHGRGDAAPGQGPRHLKFSPDGRYVYVLNELGLSVDAFAWDAQQGLMSKTGSFPTLLPEEQAGHGTITASEIRIHPSGKFLYTANRTHDTLSVFAVDKQSGALERIQVVSTEVKWPRNFNLDPSGAWLLCAGQNSNEVGVFKIDPATGKLSYMDGANLMVPRAICVEFAP